MSLDRISLNSLTHKDPHERFTRPRELDPSIEPLIQEQLDSIIADPANYIDKGGAGQVYRLGDGVCMKVLEKRHDSPYRHMMKLGNSIQQEGHFIETLSTFNVKGVRSPSYIGFIQSNSADGHSILLMEELDAVNLQHILNGTEAMPKSFELNTFLDSFEGYINALNNDRAIAHGDLFARNVMVDRTSGMPRIIDFGKSVRLHSIKSDPRRQMLDADWANMEAIEEQIDRYVQSEPELDKSHL